MAARNQSLIPGGHTADQIARREGRNPNDWCEGQAWTHRIARRPLQFGLFRAVQPRLLSEADL
jgi:hypothetical protein